MTEHELRQRLNQLTHEIPASTHRAYAAAALSGQEARSGKRKLSFGVVLAIVVCMIALTACAAGIVYNQRWYYKNRGATMAENKPEIYEAILRNMDEAPAQSLSEDSRLDIVIQDVSWAPEARLLTVSFRAAPKDPARDELHPMGSLDQDGAYVGEGGSTNPECDGEDRAMHWLWRIDPNGEAPCRFGPPMDMMDDPAKRLLLIGTQDARVSGSAFSLTGGTDMFRTAEGDVVWLAEFSLDWLDEDYDERMRQWADELGDEEATQYAKEQIEGAKLAREAVRKGELPCDLVYSVVEYTEGMDDGTLYAGGEHGVVHFLIRPKTAE